MTATGFTRSEERTPFDLARSAVRDVEIQRVAAQR
jgi:hypothetical protein